MARPYIALGVSRSQNQLFAQHSKFKDATAEAAKQAAKKAAAEEQAEAQKKQTAAQDKAAIVAGQVVSSGDECPADATKEEATVRI